MIAGTRYLIIPAAMYVATYVIRMGDLSAETVTPILSAIVGGGMFAGILLSPKLYAKFGYKRVYLTSAFVGAAFLGAGFFVGVYGNYYASLAFVAIGGLALGTYNVLPYPMSRRQPRLPRMEDGPAYGRRLLQPQSLRYQIQ